MKTRTLTTLMKDHGRVSRVTRGDLFGIIHEMTPPPFNWLHWPQ